jgi:hypothetical protein
MRLIGVADRGISSALRLIANRNKRRFKLDFRSAISDSNAFMTTRSPVGRANAGL